MSINLDKKTLIPIVLFALGSIIIALTVLQYVHYKDLSKQLLTLETRLSSTTAELTRTIAKNQMQLSDELSRAQNSVGNIEQSLGTYSKKVDSFSNTVTTLEKLSKTDPQLLAKYSKVFFLNENYAPPRLTEVPSQYKYSESKIVKFHSDVWSYLRRMIDAAKKDDVQMYVHSGYRSFKEQQNLKGQYSTIYGVGTANQFSADQGYSEHQLGTTVDLITQGMGGQLDGFENTKSYTWLQDNAYKYGFILSYPKNNNFYIFEPWHWRFIGVKLAIDLHNKGTNFYDMDQRDIDEYLVNFLD